MKLLRVSAAVACSALVVTAAQAGAAPTKPKPKPKPPTAGTCGLVTDPAGDANGINPGAPVPATHAGPSDDGLDILAIDLATGTKTMTWVMRIKKLTLAPSSAPAGETWRIHFTIRKTKFFLAAHADTYGPRSDATYLGSDGKTATLPVVGIFDTAHSEIRFTLLTAALAKVERAPLTATMTGIGGVTGQEIAGPQSAANAVTAPAAYNAADWTDHDVSYTPGKPVRCG
jgi:hypothetical protein